MESETLQLEYLADDVELRRAAAKTLKGFCPTYLPHHFPADLSNFFDEMASALSDHDIKRLEIIGFRGCAKSTMASLALVIWVALEHPHKYPFIIMLADTHSQASINATTVRTTMEVPEAAGWECTIHAIVFNGIIERIGTSNGKAAISVSPNRQVSNQLPDR
jgi:hypothetical protein